MFTTLALYSNENGEEQQCVLNSEMSPEDLDLKEHLPYFNEGSNLFLIDIDQFGDLPSDARPDVFDGYGQEIPCHFVTIRADAQS